MNAGVSKSLGLGETIEFEGQVYHLTPTSVYERRGEFEKWCKRKARAEVTALRREVEAGAATVEEYEDFRDRVSKQISGGYFDAGGEGYTLRAASVDGQIQSVWLSLQPKQPDIKLELVERMYKTAFEEVREALREANRDPNPPAVPGAEKSPSSPPAPSSPASPGN